jgi:hypothetical protein
VTSGQPKLLVETSRLLGLAVTRASRVVVGGGSHMLGAQTKHTEGRRTSVEGIRIHGRTYHEHVNLGAMHAWMSGMFGMSRWRCTSVDSLLDELP